MNRGNRALSRGVGSAHKRTRIPPAEHESAYRSGMKGAKSVAEILEPLRLGRYIEGCVMQGYCFAEDLTSAVETHELTTLFAALQMRKPDERRLRRALVNFRADGTSQGRRGRGGIGAAQRLANVGETQELVGELLEPLHLGRYTSLMSNKGYSFTDDIIHAEDGAQYTNIPALH